MALVYVAKIPLSVLCPTLNTCIGLPSIQLSADLSGSLALNVDLTVSPPTAALYLSASVTASADIALAESLSLPTVAFTAAISADIEVSLALSLSLLANFDLGLSLERLLSASIGLYAYTYEGVGSSLGAALTTTLATSWPDSSPTSTACNALIFGATSSAAMTALVAFLDGLTFASGLSAGEVIASLGLLSVLTAKAETQASAAITAKATAQAKITAALGASVAIPTPAATLTALAKFQANLTAQLSLAPPAIGAAVSASASIAANINATANFMAAFGATFGLYAGEMFVYTYSGTGTALGADVTTALASHWGDGTTPTSGACEAVVLATTDSFTWSVVGAFFGGA